MCTSDNMNMYSCFDTQQDNTIHKIEKTILVVRRVCNILGRIGLIGGYEITSKTQLLVCLTMYNNWAGNALIQVYPTLSNSGSANMPVVRPKNTRIVHCSQLIGKCIGRTTASLRIPVGACEYASPVATLIVSAIRIELPSG